MQDIAVGYLNTLMCDISRIDRDHALDRRLLYHGNINDRIYKEWSSAHIKELAACTCKIYNKVDYIPLDVANNLFIAVNYGEFVENGIKMDYIDFSNYCWNLMLSLDKQANKVENNATMQDVAVQTTPYNEQLEQQYLDLDPVIRYVVDHYKQFEIGMILEFIHIDRYCSTGIAKKLGSICDVTRMVKNKYNKLIEQHTDIFGSMNVTQDRVRVYTLKSRDEIPYLYAIIDYKQSRTA